MHVFVYNLVEVYRGFSAAIFRVKNRTQTPRVLEDGTFYNHDREKLIYRIEMHLFVL